MSIINLILRPLTSFVLYRIYQGRFSGQYTEIGMPGGFGAGKYLFDVKLKTKALTLCCYFKAPQVLLVDPAMRTLEDQLHRLRTLAR